MCILFFTETKQIKLVLRHYIPSKSSKKVNLSGYGVELAIKSTEYKAQDDTRVKGEVSQMDDQVSLDDQKMNENEGFIFSTLKENYPNYVQNLNDFQNHLYESLKEIATFKVWELQELSLQAATKILSQPKEKQLFHLQEISQNFPILAKSLMKVSVSSKLKYEVERNQQVFFHNLNLGPTDTSLFVNGMFYDMDSVDIFTLFHELKQEMKLVQSLNKVLGIGNKKVKKLLRLEFNAQKSDYQIDIRDSSVFYINDIETDSMYRHWPSSVQDLLRPAYPGVLRSIRKNIFHLVLIVDPSKQEAFDVLKLAESFYIHKAPLRIGLVFAINSNMSINGYQDAGVACLNAFDYISQQKSPYDGLSFLTDVIASVSAKSSRSDRDLLSKDVIDLFKAKFSKANLDIIFGDNSEYDSGRKLAWDFINRTNLEGPIKALLNGVILKETHLNAELFEEAISNEIMRQTPYVQKAVYRGELSDHHNVLDWLMSQDTVVLRFNPKILGPPEKTIEITTEIGYNANDAQSISKFDQLSILQSQMKYIANSDICLPVTVWMVVDLNSIKGVGLLNVGLKYLRSSSKNMRIGILHSTSGLVTQTIEAAQKTITNGRTLLTFLIKYLTKVESSFDLAYKADDLIPDQYLQTFRKHLKNLDSSQDFLELHSSYVKSVLKLKADSNALLINGKIIEIAFSESLVENDFALIEKHIMISYSDKIMNELSSSELADAEYCSDVIMKVGIILTLFPSPRTRHDLDRYDDKHSAIILPPKYPDISIEMIAIVEPLSRGAQKLSSILLTLTEVFNIDLKVYLNCILKHSEMPLKSFYRYVIDHDIHFNENDENKIINTKAQFTSMPSSPLFTVGVITPENWLVEAVSSIYDLDNIHLEEVESGEVVATFELDHLLLEGHCFEQSSGNPPRSLQFLLDSKTTSSVDTIVMANLGYFQLKANPGAWSLKLRPGRSNEIYSILTHENTDPSSNESNVIILMNSFRSNVIKVRVNKKAGMANEDLLQDDGEDDFENSIWGSISSWTGSKKKSSSNVVQDKTERLDIFSLASGHLYERLLRIMMLSVIKHTKTPVKFWFLKNYLSPSFKNFLPYMAKAYKFEYELVQYKWPRWLHQQTEKQRVIWGYKILFLDVLFPLDVKKIIFVDADQVVRADLKELYDLDLEGAPYGYTPFCDSREDMDGFRFWKSGYWASHLHGRKYHISALYVVDLQKFRKIAAGDRLRGQYQGLSQDPNSLSNLDQDLPNNMIHQVNIKSLPQEWLWCETWCDDASKAKAKTIDLCNNPKTKEPKLTSARRIISEWEGYDNEIKEMMKQWKEGSEVEQGLSKDGTQLLHQDQSHVEL